MFENKIIKGIHMSRYIASWINVGGTIRRPKNKVGFISWLETLSIDGEPLSKDEVWQIYCYATDGKLELEEHARNFLREKGL